ncbi:hypothetical protein RND71_012284 [Anisodus tanguticus]|uniref:Uncharacterized protein n=1 Tax=Anisodus tanguticus TaxID=243964 RepID=A0AAE1SFG3_9SOLA|nr:hypothetical protein RND71_012284 [Anisodus tanguticus]
MNDCSSICALSRFDALPSPCLTVSAILGHFRRTNSSKECRSIMKASVQSRSTFSDFVILRPFNSGSKIVSSCSFTLPLSLLLMVSTRFGISFTFNSSSLPRLRAVITENRFLSLQQFSI